MDHFFLLFHQSLALDTRSATPPAIPTTPSLTEFFSFYIFSLMTLLLSSRTS